MRLDSFGFFLFLAVAVTLHWCFFPRSRRGQNLLLLSAGALFCGLTDTRSLVLLAFSAVSNFYLILRMSRTDGRVHNAMFWAALALNLGALGCFKYLGLFAAITEALSGRVTGTGSGALSVLVPVGISFYTLRMVSYLVDVDREEMAPCDDLSDFLTFSFFFPQLLAGPIERARRFLPQLAEARTFDTALASDGCRQILWGLFTKVVIADPAGTYVDTVFSGHAHATGSTLLLAAVLYLFQIYCDFAGYSNMAVGVAKLFGLRLMMNFQTPFFATDIGDFWRRWHISLSSWMMDYVYTPLTFVWRGYGKGGLIAAILVTFFAVGLWHGATWPSIVFGLSQGMMFIPLVLAGRVDARSTTGSKGSGPFNGRFLRMVRLFVFLLFAFIIARAETITKALQIMRGIVSHDLISIPARPHAGVVPSVLLLLVVEWWQRGRHHALDIEPGKLPWPVRSMIYCALLLVVVWSSNQGQKFIYTQF